MSINHATVKSLKPQNLLDAKLFCDRYNLMRHIAGFMQNYGIKNPRIVDTVVALGELSEFIVEIFLKRRLFSLIYSTFMKQKRYIEPKLLSYFTEKVRFNIIQTGYGHGFMVR